MDLWNILEIVAWILSAIFAILMLYNLFRVDTTYDNDLLTSSREGEIEVAQERHQI